MTATRTRRRLHPLPNLDPPGPGLMLHPMNDALEQSLAAARRARPAPLPAGFAERVVREALRGTDPLPRVFTRAGLAASFAAAVVVAGAITWEFARSGDVPQMPPIDGFSPSLLTP